MLTGRSGTGFGEIRGDSSGLYAPGITADLEFDAGSEEVVATPITESHNSLESFVNGGVRCLLHLTPRLGLSSKLGWSR